MLNFASFTATTTFHALRVTLQSMEKPGNRSFKANRISTSAAVRDAKATAIDFQQLLKRKEPFDRDVEALRESLRRSYIEILFSPYISSNSSTELGPLKSAASISSHHSRILDVLNLLWLETSHALIVIYRAKVVELDKAMAEQPAGSRGGANRGGRGGPAGRGNSAPGPTARRRLLQTFRSFLSAEEDFFRDLLSRFTDSLSPNDSALAGLRSLGITVNSDSNSEQGDDEPPPPLSAEAIRLNREKIIPLAHKALICFGDLARYRELYKEVGSGGDGKKDNGKKGRKTEPEKKVKNWTKSAECYHQARLLLPDNGNPSNQLAVLSNYAHDALSSSYHYYRALTVKSPFPTARTNLQITYGKVVGKWFSAEGPEVDGDEGAQFRAAFVALHGLFYLRERMSDIPALQKEVEHLFKISVTERLLSSDLIVKTTVTGLCALYNARMLRSSGIKKGGERSKSKDASATTSTDSATSAVSLEPQILIHVLSLFKILLSIGTAETDELVSSNSALETFDPTKQLANNISAVLRRTLPAIRILSKWIIGQLDYIGRIETRLIENEKKILTDETDEDHIRVEQLQKNLNHFWFAYSNFINSMKIAFPVNLLPDLGEGAVWLEEDVDMLGFAPLKKGMKEGLSGDGSPIEISRVGKDVHPNEEQLMRIAEIQQHSILVADSESSGVVLIQGQLSAPNYVPEPSPKIIASAFLAPERASVTFDPSMILQSSPPLELEEEEYDFDLEDITEDDPVDLAMRIAEASKIEMDFDDDDDEEIVYQSLRSTQLQNSRSAPQLLPPPNSYAQSAPSQPRHAGDLLHQVLSGQSNGSGNSHRSSSPSGSPFHQATSPPSIGPSIWSSMGSTNNFFPPSNPTASGSFESLPNMTRNQAFDLPPPSNRAHQFSDSPNGTLSRSPFGSFLENRGSPSRTLPPPASFNSYPNQYLEQFPSQPSSDLSARADPFSFAQSSDPAINAAGWPQLSGRKLPPPNYYSNN